MNALDRTVNTVFISDNRERFGLIRALMSEHALDNTLEQLPARGRVAERVRRMCVDPSERRPDLVMVDFTEPSAGGTDLLSDLALGKSRLRVPVVILTSKETEDMLQSGSLDDGEAVMFAPGELRTFVKKLSDRRRKRYLWSLAVLYQYGPILLRSADYDETLDEPALAHAG